MIDCYNKYGAQLVPPRPPLLWEQIAEYTFLGEFELLRNPEISTKKWAHASFRSAANLYFDAERAREEILRCNVEIARLRTKIRDDSLNYPAAISRLQSSDPPLAAQLTLQWKYLQSVNSALLARIAQIESLEGYTGGYSAGTREGLEDVEASCSFDVKEGGEHLQEEENEDHIDDEQNTFADFFASMHL